MHGDPVGDAELGRESQQLLLIAGVAATDDLEAGSRGKPGETADQRLDALGRVDAPDVQHLPRPVCARGCRLDREVVGVDARADDRRLGQIPWRASADRPLPGELAHDVERPPAKARWPSRYAANSAWANRPAAPQSRPTVERLAVRRPLV